jgi:hypothetical protein
MKYEHLNCFKYDDKQDEKDVLLRSKQSLEKNE